MKRQGEQKDSYLPIRDGKSGLIIEDEDELRLVVEKMLAAGVEVITVEVD